MESEKINREILLNQIRVYILRGINYSVYLALFVAGSFLGWSEIVKTGHPPIWLLVLLLVSAVLYLVKKDNKFSFTPKIEMLFNGVCVYFLGAFLAMMLFELMK